MGRGLAGTDGYSTSADEEFPEHNVTLRAFRLGELEVTVGRFRKFAAAEFAPAAVADAHPTLLDSRWNPAWNTYLPASPTAFSTALRCSSASSWTSNPGTKENLPVVCASWHEAMAFCIWVGGRLPTQAEWELAAAGSENRLFPWGSDTPSCLRANHFFGGTPCVADGPAPVGAAALGISGSGQLDLAGNAAEWVYDGYSLTFYAASASTADPIALTGSTKRAIRGGSYRDWPSEIRSSERHALEPATRSDVTGFRCAYPTE